MSVYVVLYYLCKYKLINSVNKLYFGNHLAHPLSLASKAKAMRTKEAANNSDMI